MAIRKIISIKGSEVLKTSFGEFLLQDKEIEKSCYIKVESVNSTKTNASAVVSYTSDIGKMQQVFKFQVTLDGKNFIAQAYEHLKTLPEFVGAEDC